MSSVKWLVAAFLACQPLIAQSPLTLDEIREGILRLRECRLDRTRVADLEAETERLRNISAMLEEAYRMRLESEQRARELDKREAAIEMTEVRGQLAAWKARSRDQSALIEELSKRRKWWCLWMCSRGIKTREIPEP